MVQSFPEACATLFEGQPLVLASMAAGWRNFAVVCQSMASHVQATAEGVSKQHGAPYQNFGDRAGGMAKWLSDLASQVGGAAEALSTVSMTGNQAQWTAAEKQAEVAAAHAIAAVTAPFNPAAPAAAAAQEQQAAVVLNGEIMRWSGAYAGFTPGKVPPAPVNSTGGEGIPAQATDSGSAATPAPGVAGPGSNPPAGPSGSSADPGSADRPGSPDSTQGHPGFEGWVQDPRTGYLVDPATGREFDPTTGRWVDPITGQPFGEVARYAARLEGLQGGIPIDGGPLFATGGSGGGGQLGGLYGGVIPPSLVATNPAAAQLRQTAANSMAARAAAAASMAARDGAHGLYPFVPPMQGGVGADGGQAAAPRARYPAEPRSIWAGNRGDARAAAAAALVPPLTTTTPQGHRSRRSAGQNYPAGEDVWTSDRPATRGVLGDHPS